MSSSPELSASAKEFVPGSFAGAGTLGVAPCTGFHFDPSACEFSPSMMAVTQPNPMPVSVINFACYSSDDDTPPPSPRPASKTTQSQVPKVETPVATVKVETRIAATHERCDGLSAKTTDELCKSDTAVAPWKRKQQSNHPDSPKSPVAQTFEDKPAPWRKASPTQEPSSSKPWRPWHNNAMNAEEDKETAAASLSDASTESPISTVGSTVGQNSTGGGSPKSIDPESADDQESDVAESPVSSSSAKQGPTSRLTASLGGYLGPQRPPPKKDNTTFSVMDMLRWRAASVDLQADNFTYLTDFVDMPEAPSTTASKTTKGGWREDAARSQRANRNARRPEGRSNGNAKQVDDVEPLQKSNNSWAMRQEERRARKTLNPDGKSDDEIVRSMKSILNKLTIEKYDKLYLQMINCGISTVEHVKILIHEVMEKAQTQHHFIEMYSTFCVHLHEWFNENEVSDDPKTGFKRILLNECQNLFERCLKAQDLSNVKDAEELAEAKVTIF